MPNYPSLSLADPKMTLESWRLRCLELRDGSCGIPIHFGLEIWSTAPVKQLQKGRDEEVKGVGILIDQKGDASKEVDNTADGMQGVLPGCWRLRRRALWPKLTNCKVPVILSATRVRTDELHSLGALT